MLVDALDAVGIAPEMAADILRELGRDARTRGGPHGPGEGYPNNNDD